LEEIMTLAPGRIETLNGVQLYVEVHGIGEPLILLHGFGGCSQDWPPFPPEWNTQFQFIIADQRGHGRSSHLSKAFRFDEAAADTIALLDHLGVGTCKGIGISGGGNILLHLATRQPERVKAMVLVSATSYFPNQARPMMRSYPDGLSQQEWETMRRRHPGGDEQIKSLLASSRSFADSYDDMNFTSPYLSTIKARTLLVQGDRDPFYPAEISLEMARAIPLSSLWIVPGGGHGPIGGEKWPEFLRVALGFLRE
jgi:pimeloyl-ACP methyl ester carboxylesterase